MNTRKSPEQDWLDKNHSAIKWNLKTPDISNPFDASVTESKLEDFMADKSMVMEACQVVAIMDETEILRISDLTSLKFSSDHPNLVNINAEGLDGYMKENGVWDLIEEKIDAFRKDCSDELNKRQAG